MRIIPLILALTAAFSSSVALAEEKFPSDPTPATDKSQWIVGSDWPRDLYVNNVEASVSVELDVDANGRARVCRVTQSSGYDSMDNVVCSRLPQRASFKPARDNEGRAVAGIYNTTVQFSYDKVIREIPETPENFSALISMVVERDGSITHCERVESPVQSEISTNECPVGARYQPVLNESGEPVRIRLEFQTAIVREVLPD